jgi:hypothetical protein
LLKKEDNDQRANQLPPVVMCPGVRRDDTVIAACNGCVILRR